MLFHVTTRDKALNIWKTGKIEYDENINQNRTERRELRKRIDKLGRENYSSWVNRRESVFAWSTFDKAVMYSERFLQPAIVEFETDGTCWCVENYAIEDLLSADSLNDEDIESVVNMSKKWDGESRNEIEVWVKPQSISNIYRVSDEFGSPLSLSED